MRTIAIIAAGGEGKRMGRPKQFLEIAGKPMLEWTLSAFQNAGIIDGIILVVGKGSIARAKKLRFSKVLKVVAGGKERRDSVERGLNALPLSAEIVVIHDGARPAVTGDLIERSVRAARELGAAVAGVPVKDTIKRVKGQEARVRKTIDRTDLWQAQTPQTFKVAVIKKAYARLKGPVTDDAMAAEKLGLPVKMIPGSYANLKVTTPEDLMVMEGILKERFQGIKAPRH